METMIGDTPTMMLEAILEVAGVAAVTVTAVIVVAAADDDRCYYKISNHRRWSLASGVEKG